jgi:hypothetical protein
MQDIHLKIFKPPSSLFFSATMKSAEAFYGSLGENIAAMIILLIPTVIEIFINNLRLLRVKPFPYSIITQLDQAKEHRD